MEHQKKQGKEFVSQWSNLKDKHRIYVGLVPLLEDAELNCPARILFHIVSSLSYVEGFCYATNELLGSRLGLKKGMVKRYLKELQDFKLVRVDMVPCSRGFQRQIHVDFIGITKRYAKIQKKQVNNEEVQSKPKLRLRQSSR